MQNVASFKFFNEASTVVFVKAREKPSHIFILTGSKKNKESGQNRCLYPFVPFRSVMANRSWQLFRQPRDICSHPSSHLIIVFHVQQARLISASYRVWCGCFRFLPVRCCVSLRLILIERPFSEELNMVLECPIYSLLSGIMRDSHKTSVEIKTLVRQRRRIARA